MPPTRQQQKSEQEKPKKSIFKRIFLTALLLFVFAVGGLAIYLSTLDVDSYRQQIASYISKETGLQVNIESLNVDFSHGLGLKAGGVSVESGDGERHIFSAESLFLQAKLKPLLKQKFEVKNTSIIKPVVTLHLEPQTEENTTGRTEKPLTKDQLHLETIRKSLRDYHLTVDIIEIREAYIHLIQPTGQRETAIVSLDLKLNRPDPEHINALAENLDLAINNFHMTGNVGALDVLSETGNVSLDLQVDPFSSSDLQRIFKILPASSQQIINKYPFSGNIKTLSIQANSPIEAVENIDDLIKQAEINLALGINDFSMKNAGFGINLKTLEMEQKWSKGSLKHKINTSYMGGKFLLAGNLRMEGEEFESPFIDSNLQLVNVDAGGLQIKNDWMPKSGKVSGNFKVKGPLKETDKIKLEGTFSIRDLNLNPPKKNPNAQVSFTKLDGTAQWDKGVIRHDINGNGLGSDFTVKGVLNLSKSGGATKPIIDSDFNFSNIDTARIKPFIDNENFPDQGSLSTTFHLSGPLSDLKNIRWKGTVEGKNLVLNKPDGSQKASFQNLKIKGNLADNKMKYDLIASAFGGDLSSNGSIKLNKSKGTSNHVIDADFNFSNINPSEIKPLIENPFFPDQGTISTVFHLTGPLTEIKNIRWKGTVDGKNLVIKTPDGLPEANFPILKIKGDWANNNMKYDINASALGGDFSTNGELKLSKVAGNNIPVINAQFEVNNIDLKPLKPIVPADWFPAEGMFSSNFKLVGPLTNMDKLKWDGTILVDKMLLIKGQGAEASNIPVRHLEIKGNWSNRKLKHDIQANLFGGQAKMIGDLALKKNVSGKTTTNIHSNIKFTKLNFSNAKLPWQWAPTKGLLSGSINLSGEQGEGKAVMFNGKLLGEKLVFKPEKNQQHSIGRADIIAKSISSKLTTINMNLKEVLSNQSAFKQIKADINQTPDTITVTRGTIYPPNGEILVKGIYKLPKKAYKFDLQGRKLKLEDYAPEDVISPLQFDGSLNGHIPEKEPATRGLNGKVNFKAGKGRFHKFKLAQGILTLFNPNAITTKSGLGFDYLGGDIKIVNGLMSTKNLAMNGNQLKVDLKGTADLTSKKMNLDGVAQTMQLLDAALKKIPVFGQILSDGKDGIIKTNFKIRGTFDNPHVKTDVAGKLIDKLTGN